MVRSAEHGLQTSLKFFGHHVERSPEKDQRLGELFMEDIKKKYKTVMADHFPETMKIVFGDQTLEYRKRTLENRRFVGRTYRKRATVTGKIQAKKQPFTN